MQKLTVFYDAHCPLCRREMEHLARQDHKQLLQLENIHAEDFQQRFPHIDVKAANSLLHGELADGQQLFGLDVTHQAWRRVGKGWLTAPLRWPFLRHVADFFYSLFAKHRTRLARWLTAEASHDRCETGSCQLPSNRRNL